MFSPTSPNWRSLQQSGLCFAQRYQILEAVLKVAVTVNGDIPRNHQRLFVGACEYGTGGGQRDSKVRGETRRKVLFSPREKEANSFSLSKRAFPARSVARRGHWRQSSRPTQRRLPRSRHWRYPWIWSYWPIRCSFLSLPVPLSP